MQPKPTRWWDLTAAIFLLIALLASAVRLQTTNWTSHLDRAQWMVLIGVVLGLALGKSRLKTGVSFIFGLVYSLFFVPWALGTTVRSALWLERLQILWGRMNGAAQQLINDEPVKDPILILGFLCLLYWLAAFIAGYQLTRNARPWGGLIAAGVTVLIIDYSFEMFAANDSGTALSLIFFFFSVLLVARVFFLRSRSEWSNRGQMIESEVGVDLSRGAAVAGLVLVLLAWLTPQAVKAFTPGTVESRVLSERFQEFRDRVSNAVSALESSAPVFVESLGDTLPLGRGTNLSEEIAFTVKPEGGRLVDNRYYWTGRIYDLYTGIQWVSTETFPTDFGPGIDQVVYDWQGRREISVEISTRMSLLRTLYYPNMPISISRRVEAEVFTAPDGEMNVTALISDPPVRANDVYTVRASLAAPTVRLMESTAGMEYPEWVIDRYTQLPADFSPRIRELAQEIAGDLPTHYDQVIAVTHWLRQNITYTTSLPELPIGVDLMEWFLFDLRQGFCNYYATAQVLMLRSLGIPARMVVGYAQGTWVVETESYHVAGRDYHAWPEVYFPTIGWVPFEPTAGQPSLEYPVDAATGSAGAGPAFLVPTPFIPPNPGSPDLNLDLTAELQRQERQRILTIVISSVATSIALGLLVFAIYRWRKYSLKNQPLPTWLERTLHNRGLRAPGWLRNWSIRAQRTPMENLFSRVPEMLRVWGLDPDLNMTPSEQVSKLSNIVPELNDYAMILLKEYQLAAYSIHKANIPLARQASANLRQKGFQLWFQRLIRIG